MKIFHSKEEVGSTSEVEPTLNFMDLHPNTYYHLFNRTNNRELLFKESENYIYFLNQFKNRFEDHILTLAYCLMPTHFHFLIYVVTEDCAETAKLIGIWLSAYTKAINKRYQRTGSLFQKHTKAIPITDDKYLLTLITYIHQNPIRSQICNSLDEWPYSSYQEYVDKRSGYLIEKERILDWFSSIEEFKQFSNATIRSVDSRYWI